MGGSSRRPHWMPLLSAENRNALNGRVRNWYKQHEGMPTSYLVKVQAGADGVMVWWIFSSHTLVP